MPKGYTYVGDFTQATGKVLRMYRHNEHPERHVFYEGRRKWNIMDKILASEAAGLFSSD